MNKYYELKPISDPPKEDGRYFVINDGGYKDMLTYEKDGRWLDFDFDEDGWFETDPPKFYLAPRSSFGSVWVDTSERLPAEREKYYHTKGVDWMAYLHSDGKWTAEGSPARITHWLDESGMPAPLAEPVEGMRWRKASEFEFIGRKTYCAKFNTNDGKEEMRGSGYFQFSDGVFFWHNQGYIPIEKALHHQLFILDDSSTPSAREAELKREVHRLKELIQGAFIAGANADNAFCGFPSESTKYRIEIFNEFKQQHNL